MSDIDPGELEKALAWMESHTPYGNRSDILAAAARAHLATLPRYKEVEVVQWAACDEHDVFQCFDHEEDAREYVGTDPNRLVVVRLTGTAKVKVNP